MNTPYGIISIITLIIFGYTNWQIIVSDFRKRKIPNKQLIILLILLPIWWISIIHINIDNLVIILLQISMSTIVAFLLYYFQLWGAGDAKYLLILSLYIPNVSMIIFIGNITIITITLLIKDLLWFCYNEVYRIYHENITKNIFTKEKIKQVLKQYRKQILIFLTIFVCIRLGRIHIIGGIYSKYSENGVVVFGNTISPDYILLSLIGIFIGGIFILRYLVARSLIYLGKKGLNSGKIKDILTVVISSFLCAYIVSSFYETPYKTFQTLVLIFTIYLGIVLCVLGIKKLVFLSLERGERYKLPIKYLSPGIVIDHKHLNTILLNKQHLIESIGYDLSTKTLQRDDIKKLRKVCKYINTNIDKNKTKETYVDHVIAIKTLAYAPYILGGFCISLIFGNALIQSITQGIIRLFIK